MRFAVDTGGTFTDLIVEDDDGGVDPCWLTSCAPLRARPITASLFSA